MEIKVKYQKGVFKPLHKVKGFKEGEILGILVERHSWNRLATSNPSFNFLKNEPELYKKTDIVKE